MAKVEAKLAEVVCHVVGISMARVEADSLERGRKKTYASGRASQEALPVLRGGHNMMVFTRNAVALVAT